MPLSHHLPPIGITSRYDSAAHKVKAAETTPRLVGLIVSQPHDLVLDKSSVLSAGVLPHNDPPWTPTVDPMQHLLGDSAGGLIRSSNPVINNDGAQVVRLCRSSVLQILKIRQTAQLLPRD